MVSARISTRPPRGNHKPAKWLSLGSRESRAAITASPPPPCPFSPPSSAVRGVAPLRASANATRTNMIFKAATKPKANKSGNWTLKRTIAEKKPADIVQNFGAGVQFGGFTKANELFSGRLAMLGFAALIVQDFLTGQGAIAQIDSELGLQLWETEDLLLLQIGVIGALAATGFASGGQPFRDLYPEDAQNLYSPKDGEKFWRQVFGLAEEGPVFGFNTNNELLLGRVAMTGFAVTTLIEAVSGRGPLEQLGFELGASSLHFEEDFFLASAAFFAVSAVFPAALAGLSSLSGFKSDK